MVRPPSVPPLPRLLWVLPQIEISNLEKGLLSYFSLIGTTLQSGRSFSPAGAFPISRDLHPPPLPCPSPVGVCAQSVSILNPEATFEVLGQEILQERLSESRAFGG